MSILIRRARKEDCSRILELVKELAEYEKTPEEVSVTLEHFADSGFGNHPVWWAYVAEENAASEQEKGGRILVGCALYYIRFSTWKGQRMYLEDIIVSKDHRGKGIGKRLFERLIEEGKEKKLHGMVWQVLEWNESAINFYKKYNASFDPEWLNGSIDF
ncbi:MAG: GNAT family N-acetyltransferase [Chitinophagaceae bacterium]